MAVVYFDSSALVRRYDATEPGAATVRMLCGTSPSALLVVVRLSGPEVASALSRKSQEGAITENQRRRMWRQFQFHARYEYRVNDLDEVTYRHAEQLLFRHDLRATDAVQIAGAVRSMRLIAPLDSDFRFCTADERQRRAAEIEGVTVEFVA